MTESFPENTPTTETENKIPKSKKSLYIILILAIVAAAVYGITQAQRNKRGNDKTVSQTGAKQEINLTDEEKKVTEAQVENYQAQINQLPGTATPEQRFSLHSRLAAAQYKLGRYEEAIATLDKIKTEHEGNHRLWATYTNIYWDMENFPEARKASERALNLDRTNPQSWLAFIELQEDQGKDRINGLYVEALDKTDDYIDVVTAYARFLEKQGDKDGAIAQWQKAGTVLSSKKAEYDGEIARIQATK